MNHVIVIILVAMLLVINLLLVWNLWYIKSCFETRTESKQQHDSVWWDAVMTTQGMTGITGGLPPLNTDYVYSLLSPGRL